MPKYLATTETGRGYVIDTDENIWYTEPDSGYGGPIRKFTVGDRPGDPWDWPNATEPEVGKSVFLATSPSNWRLSTPIVSVEEI